MSDPDHSIRPNDSLDTGRSENAFAVAFHPDGKAGVRVGFDDGDLQRVEGGERVGRRDAGKGHRVDSTRFATGTGLGDDEDLEHNDQILVGLLLEHNNHVKHYCNVFSPTRNDEYITAVYGDSIHLCFR